jgi:Golgi phosphoprotein 3 GPP34
MLIAEDLLLLLTDDRSGKLHVPANQVDIALGGGLLIELALAQRVDVAREDGVVREGRLLVKDARPTSDALLDEALDRVAAKQGKKPTDVAPTLGKNVRARLHARLVERGVLHEEAAKILGIFPSHRWPSSDTTHEDAVRALLAGALRTGSTNDAHVAALVSLLHALKAVAKVVDPAELGITKREMNANAKRIAEGDWASRAVREAIDEMLAGIIAATSSSTVVTSGGG